MKETDVAGIAPGVIDAMRARERARYEAQHPRSRELAAQAAEHWVQGVPMHWMLDWGTPFPQGLGRFFNGMRTFVVGFRS